MGKTSKKSSHKNTQTLFNTKIYQHIFIMIENIKELIKKCLELKTQNKTQTFQENKLIPPIKPHLDDFQLPSKLLDPKDLNSYFSVEEMIKDDKLREEYKFEEFNKSLKQYNEDLEKYNKLNEQSDQNETKQKFYSQSFKPLSKAEIKKLEKKYQKEFKKISSEFHKNNESLINSFKNKNLDVKFKFLEHINDKIIYSESTVNQNGKSVTKNYTNVSGTVKFEICTFDSKTGEKTCFSREK